MVRPRNTKDKYFFVALIAGLGLMSACSRDGRVLRESGPGQGESSAIVTTVAPTDSNVSTAATNLFSVSGTWVDSGSLDPRHTCLGSNVSPALTISNVPAGAQSLAISLIEITRPDQPLWVVANLTPESTVVQEGGLPAGAIVGATLSGNKIVDGYNGPCITDSEIHEFVLVVYAVDQMIEFVPEPQSLESSKLLINAIQASAFDSAETRFFVQNP
ncbi:MAG: YbhB/YbcL family Raf kinase inhibitor-like protein [Acidimicrobiaceae bacterium]